MKSFGLYKPTSTVRGGCINIVILNNLGQRAKND